MPTKQLSSSIFLKTKRNETQRPFFFFSLKTKMSSSISLIAMIALFSIANGMEKIEIEKQEIDALLKSSKNNKQQHNNENGKYLKQYTMPTFDEQFSYTSVRYLDEQKRNQEITTFFYDAPNRRIRSDKVSTGDERAENLFLYGSSDSEPGTYFGYFERDNQGFKFLSLFYVFIFKNVKRKQKK